jgi:aspartate aminotransferase
MNKLSKVGNNIVGSEIIKISQHIKQVQKTKQVLNLTMGDFDPKVNPIPTMLRDYITDAYFNDLTNYPLAAGELHLRQSISSYFKHRRGIEYNNSEILVGCGVRPLIYTVFKAIINEGDTVVYPVPSWNNNHYSFLHNADLEPIECTPENAFFPTVEDIESRLYTTTRLVCLCSPQNPTGRIIDRGVLKGICEAIVNENKQRGDKERPCYLFFDQIYSDLVGDEFTHPLDVCPEIREYLICADGISKSLCATGVRVGWLMGPKDIIGKMTEVFSHIGAWAAKPEQNAVAMYLYREDINDFIQEKQQQYTYISSKIIDLFNEMKNEGYKVDCQNSDGGIYISVYLDYVNKFPTTEDYINFLIEECGLGIVPFEYFGSKENKGWFRISIGSVDPLYIDNVLTVIKNAIIKSSSHIYGYEESR